MRESASTDLREPQGSNPLGPPGPEPRLSPEPRPANFSSGSFFVGARQMVRASGKERGLGEPVWAGYPASDRSEAPSGRGR